MRRTALARLARKGGPKARSFAVLVALCAALTVPLIGLVASPAQACGIMRKVYNKTDSNMWVEIWRDGVRQWTAHQPIKPGGALGLEYLTIGDEILVTGPQPVRDWDSNPFGVVLQIFRCDLLRVSGSSKMGDYDLKVSRKSNADILIQNKR
jgi:hypothetical protein